MPISQLMSLLSLKANHWRYGCLYSVYEERSIGYTVKKNKTVSCRLGPYWYNFSRSRELTMYEPKKVQTKASGPDNNDAVSRGTQFESHSTRVVGKCISTQCCLQPRHL